MRNDVTDQTELQAKRYRPILGIKSFINEDDYYLLQLFNGRFAEWETPTLLLTVDWGSIYAPQRKEIQLPIIENQVRIAKATLRDVPQGTNVKYTWTAYLFDAKNVEMTKQKLGFRKRKKLDKALTFISNDFIHPIVNEDKLFTIEITKNINNDYYVSAKQVKWFEKQLQAVITIKQDNKQIVAYPIGLFNLEDELLQQFATEIVDEQNIKVLIKIETITNLVQDAATLKIKIANSWQSIKADFVQSQLGRRTYKANPQQWINLKLDVNRQVIISSRFFAKQLYVVRKARGLFYKIKKRYHKYRLRQKRKQNKRYYRKYQNTRFDEPTIVFESFGGRQLSDSPWAIYEQVKLKHPNYKLVWSVNDQTIAKAQAQGLSYVKRGTLEWIKLFAMADVLVVNARLPLWLPKNLEQLYLQTWHGTPLKKLGTDMARVQMPGTNTRRYKRNFTSEVAKWDLLISPNRYSTNIFHQAFNFNKKVLEIGYPRNDKLFLENNVENIAGLKEKLAIPQNKKVILYAPTWRDNQFKTIGEYTFELPFDMKELQARMGDEYVLVLRMHYLIANKLDLTGMEDFVINASDYSDISDLYLLSDALITDYSSVFFDYAILNRPIIFYAYDIDAYGDELRGFYMDYHKDLPGPIVKDTPTLIQAINMSLGEDNGSFKEQRQKFNDLFVINSEGTASQQVTNVIAEYITKERKR
ncbi:CDP-glycerol glycerophosphotransferase family protein [Periweissella beninensis]|nr:CDP-glycerol glycerophosphotransferase family protein [Periweissella beninensis]